MHRRHAAALHKRSSFRDWPGRILRPLRNDRSKGRCTCSARYVHPNAKIISTLTTPGVSPQVAAVATDAVTTAYHAIVRRGELKPTETVFLFGLGGLGFNGLQVVKSIGARVIVSDVRQERLDAAAQLGIPQRDIVPVGKSIQEFVQKNGLMIDTTFDFVGMAQTFEDAQQIGQSIVF